MRAEVNRYYKASFMGWSMLFKVTKVHKSGTCIVNVIKDTSSTLNWSGKKKFLPSWYFDRESTSLKITELTKSEVLLEMID